MIYNIHINNDNVSNQTMGCVYINGIIQTTTPYYGCALPHNYDLQRKNLCAGDDTTIKDGRFVYKYCNIMTTEYCVHYMQIYSNMIRLRVEKVLISES